jgi:hypothetical protein
VGAIFQGLIEIKECSQKMTFINHNSFVIVALFLLGTAVIALRQRGWETRSWLILGGLAAVLVTGYFSLRPSPATSETVEQIWAQVGQGTPVLLELQSEN